MISPPNKLRGPQREVKASSWTSRIPQLAVVALAMAPSRPSPKSREFVFTVATKF